MPLITYDITVIIEDSDGEPVEGAIVTARLTKTDTDSEDDIFVAKETYLEETDENGQAVFSLWPNTRGTTGSQYRFKASRPGVGQVFNVLATVREQNDNLEDISSAVAPIARFPVQSVQGMDGDVQLDPDDFDDSGTTNKFTTAGEISKLAGIEELADVTDAANVGAAIHGATEKTTTVDNDKSPLIDTENGNVLKWISKTNQRSIVAHLVSSTVTRTVGSGGDHATINAALQYLSKQYSAYVQGGFSATISLLTGFAMAEQVLVKGVDLSWITITSVDAEVTITRSALTTSFSAEGGDTFPAFGVDNGALPIIGTVFNMNSTGTATDRHGIYAVNGSYARVLENCGIKNAGGHGAFINRASYAELHLGVFTGATQNGLYVARQSNVDAGSIDVSNAGANGIEAVRASYVDAANGLDASSAGGDAVVARDGSVVNCNGGDLSGAGDDGVVCATGATVICTLADITNATGIGINCVGAGSAVAAEQADVSGAGEYGVFAANAAVVNVITGTGTGCTLNAIRATQGSIVNAYGFDGSGALGSNGIVVEGGAIINIATGNCQQGGSPASTDLAITNGGIIYTAGMTGGSASPGVAQHAGYFLDASGRIVIGNRSAVASALATYQHQMLGTGTGAVGRLSGVFSADTAAAFLTFVKSRNATIGSHTIVQDGDPLGGITWEGSSGSAFVRAVMIRCEVDGTPGATNDMPGRFNLYTTPDGSGTLTERLRVNNAGRPYFIGHNTTASAANAFLDSGSTPVGELLRSTSSERFKRDIEPLADECADAILKLQPIWYRSKIATDRQDWSWYGLSAEEVAKIDPRLAQWGYRQEDIEMVEELTPVYDEKGDPELDENGKPKQISVLRPQPKDGAKKVPDGVAYDRLSVFLLHHAKKFRTEIDELKIIVGQLLEEVDGLKK